MELDFSDILNVDGVEGIVLFSKDGKLVAKQFLPPSEPEEKNIGVLETVAMLFKGIKEADLIFENARFYIRMTDVGPLMVQMGPFTPGALVRLNCDILMPSFKKLKSGGKLSRFLKKDIRLGRRAT